jgi:hypothetical protein
MQNTGTILVFVVAIALFAFVNAAFVIVYLSVVKIDARFDAVRPRRVHDQLG